MAAAIRSKSRGDGLLRMWARSGIPRLPGDAGDLGRLVPDRLADAARLSEPLDSNLRLMLPGTVLQGRGVYLQSAST